MVISFVLITGLGPFEPMGVLGAAIGTCLGPIPSVGFAIYIIATGKSIIGVPEKLSFAPDWPLLREVARVGMPTGVQGVLLNVAGVFLLRFIGRLDNATEAYAAYTICYSQLFALVTWAGFGIRSSSATLVGQNMGAGDVNRAQRAVYVAASLGLIWSIGWGVVFWTSAPGLLGLFDADHGYTLEFGSRFLKYLAFSGMFLVTTMAFTGALQGAGDTKKPMFIAFFSQIVVLLGVCYGFLLMDRLSDTTVLVAILCAHSSRFLMSIVVFQIGGWKTVEVGIREEPEPTPDMVDAAALVDAEESKA